MMGKNKPELNFLCKLLDSVTIFCVS